MCVIPNIPDISRRRSLPQQILHSSLCYRDQGNYSACIYKAASAAIAPRMRLARPERVFAPAPVAGTIGEPEALPVAAQLVPKVVPAPVGTAPALVGYAEAGAGEPAPRPTD